MTSHPFMLHVGPATAPDCVNWRKSHSLSLGFFICELGRERTVLREDLMRMGVQHCCSLASLCLILCNPVDCSTPGLSVPHHLPEFAHVHVHSTGDVIQPSHPLLPSSPPALYLSQPQGLFQRVSSYHQVAEVLKLQSFQ